MGKQREWGKAGRWGFMEGTRWVDAVLNKGTKGINGHKAQEVLGREKESEGCEEVG